MESPQPQPEDKAEPRYNNIHMCRTVYRTVQDHPGQVEGNDLTLLKLSRVTKCESRQFFWPEGLSGGMRDWE